MEIEIKKILGITTLAMFIIFFMTMEGYLIIKLGPKLKSSPPHTPKNNKVLRKKQVPERVSSADSDTPSDPLGPPSAYGEDKFINSVSF